MTQLLAHLVGDYILQSHDMATKKGRFSFWALYHALVYTIPFLFLTQDFGKLAFICLSHFFIDRFKLARFVVMAKNIILGSLDVPIGQKYYFVREKLTAIYDTPTGYPKETSDFLAVWLLIIADNTIHLLINYLVLR